MSWISEALSLLPEAQQVVFNLRHVEGWDSAEIANLLGRTRNWVRVTLFRARFKMRAEVEAKMGIKE